LGERKGKGGEEERYKSKQKKKFFLKSFGGMGGNLKKKIKLLMLEWSVGFI